MPLRTRPAPKGPRPAEGPMPTCVPLNPGRWLTHAALQLGLILPPSEYHEPEDEFDANPRPEEAAAGAHAGVFLPQVALASPS